MTTSIENDSPSVDGVATSANDAATRWRAAWRWHFYAAIFVLPILLTLAVTGFVILIKPTIERWAYGDMLYVEKIGRAHV